MSIYFDNYSKQIIDFGKYSQIREFYSYDYLRSNKSKYGDIGTPYYVGKGKGTRAYKKHQKGISVPKDKNFIVCTNLMNEADSMQIEMLKIHLNGRIDLRTGHLRNKTFGGDGMAGHIASQETRQKLSIASKGRIHSSETKKKISESNKGKNKGRKLSVSHKNKLSIAIIGKRIGIKHPLFGKEVSIKTKNKISVAISGKNNPNFGKQTSEETKHKISVALQGRKLSQEIKNKISKTLQGHVSPNKGKILSEETKNKMRIARQKYLESLNL